MCGIAGILKFNGESVSLETLKKMTDVIAHRGPDGEGHYVDGSLGFGHRRLAILDLSPAGSQPMQTPKGDLVINYNGEIYNFQEIRQELENYGYSFRSSTDTEVILYAYAHWGDQCVNKLNGMFAFAIWDRNTQELFLARDRYGIKPLYYIKTNDMLIFASEIKSIISSQLYTPSLDTSALIEYLTFQNFFSDRNLFKDVKILQPGHYLKIKKDAHLTSHQYWDYNFSECIDIAEEDALDQLAQYFERAVKRQLVSDVPVSTYLSGGIDSGLITLIAAKHIPNIRSFTVGFDMNNISGIELSYDEREKAEFLSYIARTEHYEMVLKSGDMERCMQKLTWALEEPRVGQCYPNFYAAKLAGSFGKVVLSGAGGDEIFAGYPWRYLKSFTQDNIKDYTDHHYNYWQRLISALEIQNVCKPILNDASKVDTRAIFEDVYRAKMKLSLKSPQDFINASLYFEAKTFLHGLLIVEDKLSMHHGLESRVPFLDNELVDFASRLPLSYKLKDLSSFMRIDENQPCKGKYFDSLTHDGKRILRDLIRRYVPEKIGSAKKQGFSAPDASWFKGESIEYVKAIVWEDSSPIYRYLDKTTVRSIVNEHISDSKNRRLFIWSVIYLHNFMNTFKI